jgi:hypothetical protein
MIKSNIDTFLKEYKSGTGMAILRVCPCHSIEASGIFQGFKGHMSTGHRVVALGEALGSKE